MPNKATQETWREYLDYDPNTGHLTWIKKPNKRVLIGNRAGNLRKDGYRAIYFKSKAYQEHHVVWCWYYGDYPPEQLDHINHVRDDNRISNLRAVTKAENARNRTRRESRVNEVGVWWCRKRYKYVAEITVQGKKVFQRTYDDIETAIQERKAKAIELGFHENHGQSN